MLESLKMAFFVVILDSKYSKMTPKFVKQKSHRLHSSIKFANPVRIIKLLHVSPLTSASTLVVKTSSDNDVFRGFSCVVVVVGVGCGGSTEVGTGTGGGLGSMSV